MKTFTGALLATLLATTECEGLKLNSKSSSVREQVRQMQAKIDAQQDEHAALPHASKKFLRDKEEDEDPFYWLFNFTETILSDWPRRTPFYRQLFKENKVHMYEKGVPVRNKEAEAAQRLKDMDVKKAELDHEFLSKYGNKIQKRLEDNGHTVTSYGSQKPANLRFHDTHTTLKRKMWEPEHRGQDAGWKRNKMDPSE